MIVDPGGHDGSSRINSRINIKIVIKVVTVQDVVGKVMDAPKDVIVVVSAKKLISVITSTKILRTYKIPLFKIKTNKMNVLFQGIAGSMKVLVIQAIFTEIQLMATAGTLRYKNKINGKRYNCTNE